MCTDDLKVRLSVLEDSSNPLHLFLSFYYRLTSAKCFSSPCTVELYKAINILHYIFRHEQPSLLQSIVYRCNRKTTDDAQGLTVQTNRITRGLTIWLISFQVKHAISNTLGCRDSSLYFHTGQGPLTNNQKPKQHGEWLQSTFRLLANFKTY